MSMPTQRRPSFCAATMAVPQPQNGSSTMSPGLLLACDDALQQGDGLLCGIAETLPGSERTKGRNVDPKHPSWDAPPNFIK